jgi:beta-galactosidase
MKRLLLLFIITGMLACTTFTVITVAQNRQCISIDFNWKFMLDDSLTAEQADFDDRNWRDLDLPHDWSIEGPYDKNAVTGGSGGFLPTGIGWYRKHLTLPNDAKGKTVWIEFDGVYMNSDAWINGHHLGNYPYGYNSFHYDLTSYVVEGENIIAVRVDNSQQPNTRWYSGSGIYRHVWLVITNPLHVGHWGTYITVPEITESEANVKVQTTIENDSDSPKNFSLITKILDPDAKEVGTATSKTNIPANNNKIITQTIQVAVPKLWSLETPRLYKAINEVREGKRTVDIYETTYGIRTIEYNTEKGFLLNGKQVKMKGVNLHHDGGCVGAAVPERVWERRLESLKQMGCNAIRTAHNPPAPEFLDLCDRMGFLVMDEALDEWRIGKREHAYHKYFDQWGEKDLIAMLHRDRNHPSIILWSVGNEIREQTHENGHEVLRKLMEICYREDPTRPVTLGCDNIAADGGATTLPFLELLDIVGYNYVDRWHERRELHFSLDRHSHPDWKMLGTESISVSSTRGEYSPGDDPNVVRLQMPRNLIRAQELWKVVKMNDFVIGDFMWTGIDYLGESWWPRKNATSGVLDLCGFPKDGYYFYKSQWTEEPMIHLFPHWNWLERQGQVIPVFCYTNCNAVELFLNDKSFGEKRLEFPRQGTSGGWNHYDRPRINPTTGDLFMTWDVPYEPGVLKAVGKRSDEVVFTKEIRTTGKAADIRLSVDRNVIKADQCDVAHVTIEIVDADGNVVPTADNLVKFTVEGEGRLIGVDNGNPQDHNSYQISQRHAFNGLCLAIVQSTKKPGKIRFEARANGLKKAVIEFEATIN